LNELIWVCYSCCKFWLFKKWWQVVSAWIV